MRTNSPVKKWLAIIVTIIFEIALFLGVIGLELNVHFNIYKFETLSAQNLINIFSDACFVVSVFILGPALIGFVKYINIGEILYSAFQSIRQFIRLGFVPKGCRKAYRKYRKVAKEEKGTGLAILFVTGFAFLIAAIVLMLIS